MNIPKKLINFMLIRPSSQRDGHEEDIKETHRWKIRKHFEYPVL